MPRTSQVLNSVSTLSQDNFQPLQIGKRKVPDVKEHTQGHTTQVCRQSSILLLRSYDTTPGRRPSFRRARPLEEWVDNSGEEDNHQSSEQGHVTRREIQKPKHGQAHVTFPLLKRKANRQNNRLWEDGREIFWTSNLKSLNHNSNQ